MVDKRNYTRAIENQLDFTHLPYTHRTTIGRGVPERLDVVVEEDGDRLHVTYDPATYDAGPFFVELTAPNLWRNRLAPGVFSVVVFVPVDEENTRLYLRFYQNYLTVPVLGRLVCHLMNVVNRFIVAQDRRVVTSQHPRRSELGIDEVLVASDRPIFLYRRWRKRQLESAREE